MRGEQLGKYELLRHIATGGMAEIHLARAKGIEGFEKIVVVKRILPQLAQNAEFVRMFLDEARIVATLHHPNIVQVYDIGAAAGSYFFAMEFLQGEEVRGIEKAVRARGQRLPLEQALSIIMGVCAGLHCAHEKVGFDGLPLNIVHRDVSPQNVIVTYDGCVKLVDFGIAKANNRLNETRSGTLRGKLRYMSPEQCRSQDLDRRSDVFSLSILLYELTTGRRLYTGKNEFEILKSIVEADAPPPRSFLPDYPPELEGIVLRGLRRHRTDRYPSAQQLQLDLEEFARERKLAVSPIALARFMNDLFADKVAALKTAQREGNELDAQVARLTEDPAASDEYGEGAPHSGPVTHTHTSAPKMGYVGPGESTQAADPSEDLSEEEATQPALARRRTRSRRARVGWIVLLGAAAAGAGALVLTLRQPIRGPVLAPLAPLTAPANEVAESAPAPAPPSPLHAPPDTAAATAPLEEPAPRPAPTPTATATIAPAAPRAMAPASAEVRRLPIRIRLPKAHKPLAAKREPPGLSNETGAKPHAQTPASEEKQSDPESALPF